MNVFELGAKIGLDTSGFKEGLNNSESMMQKFGSAVKSGFETVAKIAATTMAAATAATTAFVKSAVDTGAQFDSSMSQVAATMGKTVDEIGELRDFAKKMGSETAFSASQAADALNYMALAGYDATTSMDMLPTVLDLAAAGGIELATASDMVTDAQSALGLSLEETKVMVDQMAMASSKTNTSVAQLGEAFLTVGGTAKNLKGGTQELAQTLGIMADNGIKASEAGTHMRNIMLAMNPTTDAAVEAWDKLGVEAYDSTGALRNMSDIFTELKASMADMTDQEKTETLSAMFNKTDLAAINALLDTNKERWDAVSEAIGNADGSASQMAETQLDNLTGDVTLLKSAWEGLQIAVADKVIPAIRPFIQLFSQLASRITTTIENGGSFVDVLKDIAGGFDGMRIRLMQMIQEALPSIIETVKDIAEKVKQALEKNAPKIARAVPKIISFLIDSFSSRIELIANIAPTIIRGIVNGISKNIPKLVKVATTVINALTQFISEELPNILEAGMQILLALVDGIVDALPELIPAAIECILTLVEKLTDPDMVLKLVDAAAQIILAIADGLIEALPTLLDKAPEIIDNLCTAIEKVLPKLLETAGKLIDKLIRGLNDNLYKIFDKGKDILARLILGIWNLNKNMREKAVELMEKFLAGIGERYMQTFEAGKEIINKIKEGVMEMIGGAFDWGKDLVDNFIKGVEDKKNALSLAAEGIASIVSNFIHFSVPKEGPLSDFDESAPDMMDLFIKGIKDNEKKLKNQIIETFDFNNMIQAPTIAVQGSQTNGEGSYNVSNDIVINIQSGVISNDYDAQRTAQKISEQLAKLQTQQRRAVGM